MAGDDLTVALDWLQARLGRELSIDTGAVTLDPVLVRGGEPGFKLSDEDDSYDLDIYVKIDSIRLDAEALSVERGDSAALVLVLPGGRVTIEA